MFPAPRRAALRSIRARRGQGASFAASIAAARSAIMTAGWQPDEHEQRRRVLRHEQRPQGERIRTRTEEHVDRILRRADQRLAVDVEARVQHRADAPPRARFAQQRRERPGSSSRPLRPARAVDAGDAGERVLGSRPPPYRPSSWGDWTVPKIREHRALRFRACSDRTAGTRRAA